MKRGKNLGGNYSCTERGRDSSRLSRGESSLYLWKGPCRSMVASVKRRRRVAAVPDTVWSLCPGHLSWEVNG